VYGKAANIFKNFCFEAAIESAFNNTFWTSKRRNFAVLAECSPTDSAEQF
jgi:hypothetical protein